MYVFKVIASNSWEIIAITTKWQKITIKPYWTMRNDISPMNI